MTRPQVEVDHRRPSARWRHRGFAVVVVLAAGGEAEAQFTVCNQTLDVANIAVGKATGEGIETRGWWTIGANRCVDVIQEPLANRFVYVYASDVFGQPILRGTTAMCVGAKRFTAPGTGSCWERGLSDARFFEVDTQASDRWTLFLEAPAGG